MQKYRNSLLLLITALIWGIAFVAQSAGMEHVQPFTFNAFRNILAVLTLIPVVMIADKRKDKKFTFWGTEDKKERRTLVIGGAICGAIMAVASALQQFGIMTTSVGKAGFITALYIVLVPILGIFIGKRTTWLVWVSAVLGAVGLYFLCINGEFVFQKGDILVLLCAIVYSLHILFIDHYSAKLDSLRFSTVQLFTCAVLSTIAMLIFEQPNFSNIIACAVPLLYAGVMSSGVAFTLQVVAQRNFNPTIASLIMSLESVFAVLSGAILLKETMSTRELFGCGLMFVAIVLSQLPQRGKLESKKS